MGAPEGFEDVVATILPREGGPARPIFRFAAGVHRSSPMPRGAGAATRVSGADRWQRWLKTARTCSNGSGPSGEDSSRMISAMSKGYPGLSSRRKIRSVLSSARMPSAPFLRTEDAPRRPAANLDASSPVSAAGQPADLFASCPAGRQWLIISPPPGSAPSWASASLPARLLAQVTVDRADQPTQARNVEAVLPAQRQQHLGHRRATRAAFVVRDGHVPHRRAVLVPPRRRPQVHTYTLAANSQADNPEQPKRVPTLNGSPDHHDPPTSNFTRATHPVCPSTAELGSTPRSAAKARRGYWLA